MGEPYNIVVNKVRYYNTGKLAGVTANDTKKFNKFYGPRYSGALLPPADLEKLKQSWGGIIRTETDKPSGAKLRRLFIRR